MSDTALRNLARIVASGGGGVEDRRALARELRRESRTTAAVAALAGGRFDAEIQNDLAQLPACHGPWLGLLTRVRNSAHSPVTPIMEPPTRRWRFRFEDDTRGAQRDWDRKTSHLVGNALVVVVVRSDQVVIGLDPYTGFVMFEHRFVTVHDLYLYGTAVLFSGFRESSSRPTFWACDATGRLLWEIDRSPKAQMLGWGRGYLFVLDDKLGRLGAHRASQPYELPRAASSWSHEVGDTRDLNTVALTREFVFTSTGSTTTCHSLDGRFLYQVVGESCLATADVLLTRTGTDGPRDLRRGILVGREVETGSEIFRVEDRRNRQRHRGGSRRWSVANGAINRDCVLVSTWYSARVQFGLLRMGQSVNPLPGGNTTALSLTGTPDGELVVYHARGADEGGPKKDFARLSAYRVEAQELVRLWDHGGGYEHPVVEELCPLEGALAVSTAREIVCLESPDWGTR
jgi:hypothetical protein